MRARTLKPNFFKNELLAVHPPLCRILFAGLWCLADRDGRLEDRPVRIKAELLPYDKCNVEAYLLALDRSGFIHRYEVDGQRCIEIRAFKKHQTPHYKEGASTIPAPGEPRADPGQASEVLVLAPPVTPYPLTLNPTPHSGAEDSEVCGLDDGLEAGRNVLDPGVFGPAEPGQRRQEAPPRTSREEAFVAFRERFTVVSAGHFGSASDAGRAWNDHVPPGSELAVMAALEGYASSPELAERRRRGVEEMRSARWLGEWRDWASHTAPPKPKGPDVVALGNGVLVDGATLKPLAVAS